MDYHGLPIQKGVKPMVFGRWPHQLSSLLPEAILLQWQQDRVNGAGGYRGPCLEHLEAMAIALRVHSCPGGEAEIGGEI